MSIKFNQPAYEAFKDHFTLYNRDAPHLRSKKLVCNIPFFSTLISFVMFHEVKNNRKLDHYQRIAFTSRGILSLVPGINLSVLLLQGLGTLVALAIDGVRHQYQIKKMKDLTKELNEP